MRCETFVNLLHDWLDDALSAPEAERARAHARACPECAALERALRDALADCRDMGGEIPVPKAAAAAWRRAVREEAAGRAPARRLSASRLGTWAGLAAAILLIIGGAGLLRGERTDTPEAEAPHYAAPEVMAGAPAAEPEDEDEVFAFDFAEAMPEPAFAAPLPSAKDEPVSKPPLAWEAYAGTGLALCVVVAVTYGFFRGHGRNKSG